MLSSVTLSWDRPFLHQLVQRLLESCSSTPIDLSHLLIVVPTQQAGRRLRQTLAAATKGTGLLAPRIITPDQLIAPLTPDPVATSADVMAAWTSLLREVDLDNFRAVFPASPPKRDARWATGLAQQLASLQNQLGEYGFAFADVAARVSGTERESDRWAALAELEQIWKNLLAEKSLLDPTSAKMAAAEANLPPGEIERVLVAGVIDPLPL